MLDGEPPVAKSPNLLGKWASLVFRPPAEPSAPDELLAEPILYRARRETFIWANEHTVPFAAVSVVTGAVGLGIASAFSTGAIALIAGGLIGLALGLFVFFGYETIYKTPRRKLTLQDQRISELRAVVEGQQGLPPQELHAAQQLLERSRELEDKWRMLIPNHTNMQLIESEFAGWCHGVLEFLTRVDAHSLDYAEFKQLTPMKHEINRFPGDDLAVASADDMQIRREWFLAYVKHLEIERTGGS